MEILLERSQQKIVNRDNVFNNKLWRKITSDVCREIDVEKVGFEVISPWGFELLGDKNYLSKKLRRFYCYLGVPENFTVDKAQLAHRYAEALMQKLMLEYPKMAKDLVIVIEQEKLIKLKPDNHICGVNDKLLDVQVRQTKNGILFDYAQYVIAMLDGFITKKGEVGYYHFNNTARWRLYQLYIMQEALFGYLLPSFTREEYKAYHSIFLLCANFIQDYYSPSESNYPLSAEEQCVIDDFIFPRVKKIHDIVVSSIPEENITLACHAYHIEDALQINISRKIFNRAVEKINQTYTNFI